MSEDTYVEPPLSKNEIHVGSFKISSFDLTTPELAKEVVKMLKEKSVQHELEIFSGMDRDGKAIPSYCR